MYLQYSAVHYSRCNVACTGKTAGGKSWRGKPATMASFTGTKAFMANKHYEGAIIKDIHHYSCINYSLERL